MNFLPASQMNRRRFLKLSGLTAASLMLPATLRARPEDFVTIQILHTTDLHGHILPTVSYDGLADVGGFARCASQIRMWRRQNPHSITVDAGDVYQGTAFSFANRGRKMIECFNLLDYDTWVAGNHEFDWGVEPLQEAVALSAMPVLGSNVSTDGGGWENIQPYLIRELGGFRIGLLGVTTPGLPYWFHPSFLTGFTAEDPIEPTRRALRELEAAKVDAVIMVGHMGLRTGGDDFANRTESLLKEFPKITAFVGGHTHRDLPGQNIHGRPFTQASYHGIHCGKLDLVFEKKTRDLVGVHPTTALMDGRIESDPAVLSLTAEGLQDASKLLATPVGVLQRDLSMANSPGQPSEVERLIGAAIAAGLQTKGIAVDAVFHGLFLGSEDLKAGPKTIEDIWSILPYENMVLSAKLNREELIAILEENYGMRGHRSLIGMEVGVEGRGSNRKVVRLARADGREMTRGDTVTIAFNTFDAQSAGQRLMKLRDIVARPEAQATLHPLQTREALIRYFQEQGTVNVASSG